MSLAQKQSKRTSTLPPPSAPRRKASPPSETRARVALPVMTPEQVASELGDDPIESRTGYEFAYPLSALATVIATLGVAALAARGGESQHDDDLYTSIFDARDRLRAIHAELSASDKPGGARDLAYRIGRAASQARLINVAIQEQADRPEVRLLDVGNATMLLANELDDIAECTR